MISPVDTIKILMDEKRISTANLAETSGLKLSQIQNILYGRSHKITYLSKIAIALGVELTDIVKPKRNVQIDVATHAFATQIIGEVLLAHDISIIDSKKLQEYTEAVYKMALLDKNIPYLKGYLGGLIAGHQKLGLVSMHSVES